MIFSSHYIQGRNVTTNMSNFAIFSCSDNRGRLKKKRRSQNIQIIRHKFTKEFLTVRSVRIRLLSLILEHQLPSEVGGSVAWRGLRVRLQVLTDLRHDLHTFFQVRLKTA